MKILGVPIIVDNSPQTALRDALRGISAEYVEYDWVGARSRGEDTSLGILRAANAFQPDVTFLQLQDGTVLQKQDAAALPGVTIQWSGDVRQPLPEWYWELGRVLDLSLFSNEADPLVMKEKGANSSYMDIGFDPTLYNPEGPRGNWPEILFLASNFGDSFPLSQYRRDVVEKLRARFGAQFLVAGHGWSGPSSSGLLLEQNEANALRSTKIVVNLSHYNLERYSSDRLLRALGCGALVLSHNYDGIEKDWDVGNDLDVWNTLEELEEKINYYLADENDRYVVAAMGCARAHEEHTWEKRINLELLPMIDQLRGYKNG